MNSKVKYLSKNIFLFAFSSFVPKLFAFFLIPIYTSILSTEEYGIADLITTTTSLLIPIFSLDIQDAVIRFVMDKLYDKKDVFSISIYINTIGFLLLTFITTLIVMLNIIELPRFFFIYSTILFFLNSIYNSLIMFYKGNEEVKKVVVGSTILSIGIIVLNILFLVVFKFGLQGYICSTVLGYLLSTIYLIFSGRVYKYFKLKINKKTLFDMIKYSFPLIFSVIAWWINAASDRYILTWIAGVSASGLYAVSNKIPGILGVFYGIFSQAWSISAIKHFDKEDTDGFFGNIFMMLNFMLCILCSIIFIFNVLIAKLLYAGEFVSAWRYVPILLMSVLLHSVSLFIGYIFTATKDTKSLSSSTILGALVNTILNIVLIKRFNAYGAAIATLIGYSVIYIIRYLRLRKYIHMKINMKTVIVSYIMLFIQMILALFGNKFIILEIIIFALLLCLNKKYIISSFMMIKSIIIRKTSSEK